MTQKIIYFTAGAVVTPEETADIAALNALCDPAYSLSVSNGSVPPNLGNDSEGDPIIEACDFVAGSIPAAYSEVDEFDPDNPPDPDPLPDDEAVVADGDAITVGGATVTLAVAGNAITEATLPATNAVVADAGAVQVLGATGGASLVAGTAAVSANAVMGVRIAATAGVVTNGQTIEVTGGTVTISVAANVVAAEFTPE